jgi:hypothetical protein
MAATEGEQRPAPRSRRADGTRSEVITWKSQDGGPRFEGVLHKPADFGCTGRRYPAG